MVDEREPVVVHWTTTREPHIRPLARADRPRVLEIVRSLEGLRVAARRFRWSGPALYEKRL